MKNKSLFSPFAINNYFFIAILITGLTSFTVCHSQSPITGKWRVLSVKLFIKAGGTSEHAIPSSDIYQFEFKADHTYVVINGTESDKSTGEWSVKGNQLIMKAAAQLRAGKGEQLSTFSITGNKMIRTIIAVPPYDTVQSKAEETSIRM